MMDRPTTRHHDDADDDLDLELERRLQGAFSDASPPEAPVTLHEAVIRMPLAAGGPRSGLGRWRSVGWLAVASVLATVLIGSLIAGGPGPAPTVPSAPPATADASDPHTPPSPDVIASTACPVSGGAVHGVRLREIGGPHAFFNWDKGPNPARTVPWRLFVRFDPDAASPDDLSIWADRLGSAERTTGVFYSRIDRSAIIHLFQTPNLPGGVYSFEQLLPTPGCWRLSAAVDGRVVGTAIIEMVAPVRPPRPSPTPTPTPVATPWPAESMAPADDDVLRLAGRDGVTGLLHCGMPFPFDALDGPTGAEDRVGLEYEVLRSTAGADPDPGGDYGPDPTFREVARGADSVLFLHEVPGGSGQSRYQYIRVRRDGNDWRWGGSGDCLPRAVAPPGYGPATWTLDPAFRSPGRDTRTLHILVQELACAGGQSAHGRISPAFVTWDAREIVIEVFVQTLPGEGDCLASPPIPATLRLPLPVGDRTLFDPIASEQGGTGG